MPQFPKKWIVVVFLPLILLGSKFVHAQTQQPPLLELNDTKGEYPLGLYMEILEDPSGELGIEEVSSAAYQDSFIASDQAVLDSGFTESALWGRFKIENSVTNTNWQVVLDDIRMGLIDVYYVMLVDQTSQYSPLTQAGAAAVILKGSPPSNILEMIRQVAEKRRI